jgi:NAD(P)-dependent dehydrogenase (short-subunit alcohol dehydrogenase family)
MTLPLARDLAQHGIRVCSVAPGLFATPLMQHPARAECSRAWPPASPSPAPGRTGGVCCAGRHIVTNGHLNGEVIRLDGALRMAPR